MIANEIMIPNPVTLQPGTPVLAIMQMFRERAANAFPVVNESNVVMGVVSKDDLFTAGLDVHIPTYLQILGEARFAKDSKKELPYVAKQLLNATAEDVMNQAMFFARTDTAVEVIAAALATGKQVLVPVVDQDNKFIGAIDTAAILSSVAGSTSPPMIDTAVHKRPVDTELGYVKEDMTSRFSYIAKSRAHFWLSSTIVLFVIGFALGIIFIVDPAPIARLLDNNIQQLLSSLFNR